MDDPVTVWRIVAPAFVDEALSGAGAHSVGGRFNSPGRRAVYASGSNSLALLEMLVQANDRSRLADHLCIPLTFRSSRVETPYLTDLPAGWDSRPHGRASQAFGDQWLTSGRSLVLRVPSVVVPQEWNYLINPLHDGFSSVGIGIVTGLAFDRRLA